MSSALLGILQLDRGEPYGYAQVAGLAQAAFQLPTLLTDGFRYHWVSPWRDETVRRVVRKMIPGAIGVAAFQINVAVIQGMGAWLDTPGQKASPGRGVYDFNNPTGSRGVIAVDKVGGRVRFYDPRTFHEVDSIEVDKLPHEVAISPDHASAYVSIYGPGIFGNNPTPAQSIVVVDLETRKAIRTISVAPYFAPHGMMVAADGRLWVS